jgi:acyl carrier protein
MQDKWCIEERIKLVVVNSLSLNLKPDEVGEQLSELFGMDSLGVLEFVSGLEEEFEITIEPEKLELRTLGNLTLLTAYIRSCERH